MSRSHEPVLDRLSAGIEDLMGLAPGSLDVRVPLSTLGMDSVMAMRTQEWADTVFGRTLPVALLLGGASVNDLADHLMSQPTVVATRRNDVLVRDVLRHPVTRDVTRLLRAEQRGTPSVTHHLGFAARLDTATTQDALAGVLAGIADRHAALRTAIVPDGERGHLFEVRPAQDRPLLRWSMVGEDVDVEQRLRVLMEEPFDLTAAPLWRFELLEAPSGRQVLIYGAHHAVSDASSLVRIAAEIGTALSGGEGPAVVSNQDIEDLLRAQPAEASGPSTASELFTGCRRLELTLARPRPAKRTFRTATLIATVDEDLVDRVATQAASLGITPATVWLGTLQVFLARLRDRDRFALAVPVDTRMRAGAVEAVGFFGVPLPFPAQVTAGDSVLEVLRRTETRLVGLLDKGTSFLDAIPVLIGEQLHRENAPLVEVYFNYLATAPRGVQGLEILPFGTGYSDVDLMVTVLPALGQVRWDYSLDIIDEQNCARLAADFLALLAEVAKDPSIPARPSKGSVAVAATFALGNLPALLSNTLGEAGLEVAEAPYQQVLAGLLDPVGVFADPSAVAGVVLLRAGDFGRFGELTEELLSQLGIQYVDALRSLAERMPLIVGFLPDRAADASARKWERELIAQLREQLGIAVLAGDDWNRGHLVAEPFDERAEALAHMPFHVEFEAVIAITVTDLLTSIRRTPPKVIVVDGDETLWGGVAGEVGPDEVELTGARALLARRLLAWRSAGVLLALVSNNDEATVRAVLDRPDSVLGAEHLTVIAAGWEPKLMRVEAVADELRLGVDSFLFLDDNPVEIAAMRSALPQVLSVTCPPAGELDRFLRRLWPILPRPATAEDAARADFYRQEGIRSETRERTTYAEFLDQLGLELDIRPLTPATIGRSLQLVRRTTQFTLRPDALDESALERGQRDGEVWTVSARDRFGDYGQIGLVVVHKDDTTLDVLTWALSCRVLGRGVEEQLLDWLADRAGSLRCTAVRLVAERTARNVPARRLVAALGGGPVDQERLEVVVAPAQLRRFRHWDLATHSGVR